MPTFGYPTRPTSAIVFSSSTTQRDSPGSPFWATVGAWLVEVMKWTLPRPPRPPRATITSSSGLAQVGQQLAVRGDDGPERHQDADVLAGLAVLLGAAAVAAAPGLEVAAVAELQQRADARARLEVDAAAPAAVAAVRAALRHELLAPEAAGAVAAVAGLREDRRPCRSCSGLTVAAGDRSWDALAPAPLPPRDGARARGQVDRRRRGSQAACHLPVDERAVRHPDQEGRDQRQRSSRASPGRSGGGCRPRTG